jgi:hypothetical protein
MKSFLSFFSVTQYLRRGFARTTLCNSVTSVLKTLTYFPLNTAARFSRNAAVPSLLSSVAQATPNKTASR